MADPLLGDPAVPQGASVPSGGETVEAARKRAMEMLQSRLGAPQAAPSPAGAAPAEPATPTTTAAPEAAGEAPGFRGAVTDLLGMAGTFGRGAAEFAGNVGMSAVRGLDKFGTELAGLGFQTMTLNGYSAKAMDWASEGVGLSQPGSAQWMRQWQQVTDETKRRTEILGKAPGPGWETVEDVVSFAVPFSTALKVTRAAPVFARAAAMDEAATSWRLMAQKLQQVGGAYDAKAVQGILETQRAMARKLAAGALWRDVASSGIAGAGTAFLFREDPQDSLEERAKAAGWSIVYGAPLDAGLGVLGRMATYRVPRTPGPAEAKALRAELRAKGLVRDRAVPEVTTVDDAVAVPEPVPVGAPDVPQGAAAPAAAPAVPRETAPVPTSAPAVSPAVTPKATPAAPEAVAVPATPAAPSAPTAKPKYQPGSVVSLDLPRELSGAKPRFGFGNNNFELSFKSDIDRAIFIVSQQKKSKRDADYRAWLNQLGFTDKDIDLLSARVRERIKEAAAEGDPAMGPLSIPRIIDKSDASWNFEGSAPAVAPSSPSSPPKAPSATPVVPAAPVAPATPAPAAPPAQRLLPFLNPTEVEAIAKRAKEREALPMKNVPGGDTGLINPRNLDEEQLVEAALGKADLNFEMLSVGSPRLRTEFMRALEEYSDTKAGGSVKNKRSLDALRAEDVATLTELGEIPAEILEGTFAGADADVAAKLFSRVRTKVELFESVAMRLADRAEAALTKGSPQERLAVYEEATFAAWLARDVKRTKYEVGLGFRSWREKNPGATPQQVTEELARRLTAEIPDDEPLINTLLQTSQHEIPARQLASAKDLAEREASYGGEAQVKAMLEGVAQGKLLPAKQRAEVVGEFLRSASVPQTSIGDAFRQLFIWSLLSSGKTVKRVLWSELIAGSVLAPARDATGGMIGLVASRATGNTEAQKIAAKETIRALGEWRYLFQPETLYQSIKAFGAYMKTGQPRVIVDDMKQGFQQRADAIGPAVEHASRAALMNSGINPDGMAGAVMASIGHGVGRFTEKWLRLPGAVDDMVKTIIERQKLQAFFAAEALVGQDLPLKSVGDYVEGRMKTAWLDGTLQNSAALRRRAAEQAVMDAGRGAIENSGVAINARARELFSEFSTAQGNDLQKFIGVAERMGHEAALTLPMPKDEGTLGRLLGHEVFRTAPLVSYLDPFVRSFYNGARLGGQPFDGYGLAQSIVAHSDRVRNLFPELSQKWLDQSARQYLRDLTSDVPAERTMALGRMGMAIGIMGTVAQIASDVDDDGFPRITGSGPSHPAAREARRALGIPDFSIRKNGKWVDYRAALGEPFSTMIGIGVDMAQAFNRNDVFSREPEGNALKAAILVSIANYAKNADFLENPSRFLEAVSSPDETMLEKLLAPQAGALVPQVTKDIAELIGYQDSQQREIRSLWDRLQRKVPGWSNSLEARRDALLFRPMKRPQEAWGIVTPVTITSEMAEDVVMREPALIGWSPMRPEPKQYGVDLVEYKNARGQSAYDDWLERASSMKLMGRTLYDAYREQIKNPMYQALPMRDMADNPSSRRGILDGIRQTYLAAALGTMRREAQYAEMDAAMNGLIRSKFYEVKK